MNLAKAFISVCCLMLIALLMPLNLTLYRSHYSQCPHLSCVEELSLQSGKEGTIAAEVAQLKDADSAKVKQINDLRQDDQMLRQHVSVASDRIAELETLPGGLGSSRKELETNTALIADKDRAISSLTAEVSRLKQSEAEKTKQIATLRQDYERVQRDSLQIAEYQVQVVELTRQIEQWIHSDAAKAEELGRLQCKLSASPSGLDTSGVPSTFISEETTKFTSISRSAGAPAATRTEVLRSVWCNLLAPRR